MKFKGTIIITDPCYIDNDRELWDNELIDILSGSGIEEFGINTYIWESTIYGDWSCTAFELTQPIKYPHEVTDKVIKKNILGSFCADAGTVGVFLLDEVLKFNPNFQKWIDDHRWCVTVIKDFDGDVKYVVEEDEAFILGTGNINFITRQTGF